MRNILGCALFSAVLVVATQPLAAQAGSDPVSDAMRKAGASLSRNIVAAMDDFPVEKFQYKPTPVQMSVAQIALHLAEDNDFGCSSISGSKPADEPKLTPTDSVPKLIARMKRSFAFCESALQQLHDSQMGEMVPWFAPGQQATRAAMVLEMQNDWADHYSQLANYMRLNGILPPTARRRRPS
jgi:hypothetical protein